MIKPARPLTDSLLALPLLAFALLAAAARPVAAQSGAVQAAAPESPAPGRLPKLVIVCSAFVMLWVGICWMAAPGKADDAPTTAKRPIKGK